MKPKLTTTKPEVNMKPQDKMSGSSGMMRLMYTVILGALLCCAHSGVALAASVTVTVQAASAAANDTAHVPVTIQMGSGLTTGDVSVNLQVVAQGGAPAVGKLTFTDGDLGSESAFNNDTAGTYIGTWFSKPQTGGTINLGTLNVPIPSSAQSGQTYQVNIHTAEVDQADGSTPYDIDFSSTTLITVGGGPTPTPTTGITADVVVSVQAASAAANDTAHVPVTIQMGSGLTTGDVSVNLQVVAQGGAPAVGKLTFTDGDLGSESAFNNDTAGTYIGTWFSKPQTGGTINLGTLNVPIPSSAQSGQTYQVAIHTAEVDQPDGSTPYNDINFSSTAVITVGGPPVTPPTNTPTPTVTPVTPAVTPATATATVTQTPTKIASATPTATVTKPPATSTPVTPGGGACPTCEDDDGCQIGARGNGYAWLVLVPAIGLLFLRRRRR